MVTIFESTRKTKTLERRINAHGANARNYEYAAKFISFILDYPLHVLYLLYY
jgi:hypothetical protein